MVTKLDEELDSIEDSSVLAKILMVTKHSLILLITASRSVLAKILMVTKLNTNQNVSSQGSVLAKILMVTKLNGWNYIRVPVLF